MDPSAQSDLSVLAAAVEAIGERGYLGTSVDDLREAMGLDELTFRRRFADKEGCFLAAYDSIIAVAHADLSDAISVLAPWATRLSGALHHLLALIDANPAAARLVLIESQCAGEVALKRYLVTLRNLAPLMHEGRTSATAEHPPPILDSVLPAGIAFNLRRQLLRGARVCDLYTDLLRFLLLPYLGEAATANALDAAQAT